eukprot:4044570-Pyramimonas_sp.AAC.1
MPAPALPLRRLRRSPAAACGGPGRGTRSPRRPARARPPTDQNNNSNNGSALSASHTAALDHLHQGGTSTSRRIACILGQIHRGVHRDAHPPRQGGGADEALGHGLDTAAVSRVLLLFGGISR